jgi:S1-C subfamily serine protease
MLKRFRLLLIVSILLANISCHKTSITNFNAITKEKVFPTHSFVQVLKQLHIYECLNEAQCKAGKFTSAGSGISIGNTGIGTLVVTASHVCNTELNPKTKELLGKHEVYLEVKSIHGAILKADTVHSSDLTLSNVDLCLLHIRDLFLPGVKISKVPPQVGDQLYSISAPLGIFEPPTVPLLSGIYSGPVSDGVNAMVTIPAAGGSSGGAVLNRKMELVGVIFATKIGFRQVTLASKFDSMVRFLNKSVNKFLLKSKN